MLTENGIFSQAAEDGVDFYARSVRVDLDVSLETSQAPDIDIAEGLLDTLVGRSQAPGGPGNNAGANNNNADNNNQAGGPAQKSTINLQAAFQKSQQFQPETVKLQEGKITNAAEQGARQAGNYMAAKADAAQTAKNAAAEMRKEINGQQGPAQAAPGPSGGLGKMATNLGLGTVAGAVADTIVPGSGMALTVAAIGAGSFGAKSKSEFSSAAERGNDSVYQTASGHETVDVMQPRNGAPAMNGAAFDKAMSQGPGFGSVEAYDRLVGDSLNGMKPSFDQDQLTMLEASVSSMEQDVEMGQQMYERWKDSDLAVTDGVGNTPRADLKVNDQEMASLTRDNPALDDEPATPTISGMKLG